MSMKHKRKKNRINSIHNVSGEWIQSTKGVQEAFTQFYSSLFCETMVGRSSVKTVIVDQGPTLTDVHRDMLQCNFQEKDIKSVLDAIPVTKAPELDGFNSMFFKAS